MTTAMERLKALHEKKAKIEAENLGHLEAMQRMEKLLQEGDDIRKEIAALTASENADAAAWAANGAIGDPPPVNVRSHKLLNDRLEKFQVSIPSVQSAYNALAQKRIELHNDQAVGVIHDISMAAIEVMIDKLDDLTKHAQRLVSELSPLVGEIDTLRPMIVRELHRVSEARGGHRDPQLFQRLENIPDTKTLLSVAPAGDGSYGKWLAAFEKLNTTGELA
jgi:hypothetical protein